MKTSIIDIGVQFDIEKIAESTNRILSVLPRDGRPISLQHSESYGDCKHADGTGAIWYDNMAERPPLCIDKKVASDSVFNIWNDSIENEYLVKCLKSLSIPVVRTRIMPMKPSYCYKMHIDRTIRLHIPTNNVAAGRFIFDHGEVIEMEAGRAYILNTTLSHTAMNTSGQTTRIHTVTCLPEPHETDNNQLIEIYKIFGMI